MIETKLFNATNRPGPGEKKEIVRFLHRNLEQYRDTEEDIEKAVNYALEESTSFGGFILVSYDGNEMSGAVVINRTGMQGYIPENILVFIATHNGMRGKGIGKQLMQKTIELTQGNIALHVEPDNPARFLYEKMGFTTKYQEMRLIKKG